ncbi:MAG: hypothetical protein QHG99_00230 [Methanomicrobiales archaeon]|nr:hypothetical protein [Methanomicrobiales archaeon]
MGRSFESVRMGVNALAERWRVEGGRLDPEDRGYALIAAEMAKRHASACFCAFDDPLEAALFSALVELLKAMDGRDVDLRL